MELYKVIIIDDEPIIIEGLKIIINWEKYNCKIIGSASDGEEGLKLIQDLRPDIVITDICMPGSNGIEMIENVLSFCECRFIILSGYSDFNYAKQCITLGITEYLLKPVGEEDLIHAVLKVQEQLKEKYRSQQAYLQARQFQQQLTMLEQDEYLRDTLNSWFESPEEFIHTLNFYDIVLPQSNYYGCVAFQTCEETTIRQDFRNTFVRILKDFFSQPFLIFYYGQNTFIVIVGFSHSYTTEELSEYILKLKKELELSSVYCTIGIGNLYAFPNKLYLSCRQSVCALSYQIIRQENSVNPFGKDLKQTYSSLSIPQRLWEEYEQSLEREHFADISLSIRKIFDFMRELSHLSLLNIQINSLHLIMLSIQYITERAAVFSQTERFSNCFQQISTFTEIEQLEKYVENTVYSFINTIHTDIYKHPVELITKIENHINSHPYEDLTLTTVAQLFYISPIYLSQIFKKETGELYSDYVTNIKINAAKRLLHSTDLMVYEIADKLHYKDNRYFSKLFEKKTGMKPSEFRRL